jgi:hypothetical protein
MGKMADLSIKQYLLPPSVNFHVDGKLDAEPEEFLFHTVIGREPANFPSGPSHAPDIGIQRCADNTGLKTKSGWHSFRGFDPRGFVGAPFARRSPKPKSLTFAAIQWRRNIDVSPSYKRCPFSRCTKVLRTTHAARHSSMILASSPTILFHYDPRLP